MDERPPPGGCVADGGAPERIGIGGDSAGGHAAATVATEAIAPSLGLEDVPLPGFCWMVYPEVRVSDAVQVMPGRLPRGQAPVMHRRVGGYATPGDLHLRASGPGQTEEILVGE